MALDFDTPIERTPLDENSSGNVSAPINRVDGRLKVTGRAPYAAEYAGQDTVVYGFVLQAAIAKGRITSIDTEEAERAPGVLAVLTYKNASPPQGQGPKTPDGPTTGKRGVPELGSDHIDHYGQPVALVAAETFEQARSASRLVKPTYEASAFAVEMKPRLAESFKSPEKQPDSSVGDFDGAFDHAPIKIDVTYTTPYQSHAMMEPHATIAMWRGDKLTLWTSNQMITQGIGSVAATLRIPKENIRMISRYIGGGFGGKLDVWGDCILAALASHKLGGRPVKVVLTRQQIFEVTGHRPQTIQQIRLGANTDGRLTAIVHDVWCDNNPYETFYETAGVATRSLYAAPNRHTMHRLLHSDIPIGCSMRAPGEAVGLLALECATDELAEQLHLDPIELRIRNEPTEDPEKHIPYSTRNLIPCMREGARRFGWHQRQAKPGQRREGRWLIGMGMAAASRGVLLEPSSCRVALDRDGSLTARMAMTDIGTGTYTIMTQIAADMLGLPLDKVSVLMGDTDFPPAAGSGGSFGANSAGSALYAACAALRTELARRAGLDSTTARFEDGHVRAGNVSKTLAELANGAEVEASADFKPGKLEKEYSQQSYGAHFCEVGVDADTGETRVRRMLGVFTAGRILNEKTARSQCLGGMTFGIGAALTEELIMDPRFGAYVNRDMAEYHVPVHADVPALEVVFLPELDDKASPLKAKGLGELGICGAGAAVANAIYNACGVRIRDYPLTLDKVLKGLEAA